MEPQPTAIDRADREVTPGVPPLEAVLFDLHSTLVHQGDVHGWLRAAWRRACRDGDPGEALGAERLAGVLAWADRVWEHARVIDPDSQRDLDPGSHRTIFERLAAEVPGVDPPLADALYATLLDSWQPYAEAPGVLRTLRTRGVRTALVSNAGLDVRVVLDRHGLSELLDAVVLSYEAGAVKPDTSIFADALERIGVPAERALMVGDSWRDDGGAAELGVRTLLLPRTPAPHHGLELVLRLVGP